MTRPTQQDRDNAEVRQAIAEKLAADYREAYLLALGALGPGWTPWMKVVLLDADHRRTGDTTPAATVYKVFRGAKRVSENSVFLRRMPDGSVAQAASYEPLVADLLAEKHPTLTVEIKGVRVPVARYEVAWGALEVYNPASAERLAELRERRIEKRVQREEAKYREENPLLVWAAEEQKKEEERGKHQKTD